MERQWANITAGFLPFYAHSNKFAGLEYNVEMQKFKLMRPESKLKTTEMQK